MTISIASTIVQFPPMVSSSFSPSLEEATSKMEVIRSSTKRPLPNDACYVLDHLMKGAITYFEFLA
jgi:hypothetical protein